MGEDVINQKILNKIVDILVEDFDFDREKLQLDATLHELGLDSLDAVDMIVILEKIFEFRAEEEKVKKIRTLRDVVKFVEEIVQMKSAS
jgi:acyl carrier protein